MKAIIIGAIVLFGLIGLVVLSGGGETQQYSMQTINADINDGALLIDVRTPSEYASGYIAGAINLPLQDIQNGAEPPVAKNKPVYVYCQSGNRSAQAAAELRSAGFQDVRDLGGIGDVTQIGGQVQS